MQTWVTLAAKHATLASGIGFGTVPAMGWESLDGVAVGVLLAGAGFAVVNSSRQARSCPLPPAAAAGLARAESRQPQAGTLTRIRRRVDGLLTGMLSDDAEHLPAQTPLLVPVPSPAEPLPFDPGAAPPWHGDYVDAITGPGTRGRTTAAVAPARAERPERVGSWPYLTVVRDLEDDQDVPQPGPGPDGPDDDSAFWGPKLPQPGPGGSHRSKHRADGPVRPVSDSVLRDSSASGSSASGSSASGSSASDSPPADEAGQDQGPSANARPRDRKRPGRHAAPSAGFGATLGRRLASPRLTSRSAAHAG